MKKIGLLFLLTFIMISCSSDESSIEEVVVVVEEEEEEEEIPIETRKFISKIYYESSEDGTNIFNYNYDGNNNLTSIERNENLVSFFYEENRIFRMELTDNETGDLVKLVSYNYNSDGLLDFYEANINAPRVVKYIYEGDRIVRYYRYSSMSELNNDNYSFYNDLIYNDDTSNNVIEFKKHNFEGLETSRSTRSFNEFEDKRYFGEAAELINLPYADNLFESFHYYTNNNLKAWRTSLGSDELILYREYFYEYDEDGYCTQLSLVYYSNGSGDIYKTITKTYEYIELEVN